LSTFQLSNPLVDPVAILVLQAAIAAAGVLISYWVATKYGEMAAAKYLLNENRRREHALKLVAEPIQRLKSSLRYIGDILRVGSQAGELVLLHSRDLES